MTTLCPAVLKDKLNQIFLYWCFGVALSVMVEYAFQETIKIYGIGIIGAISLQIWAWYDLKNYLQENK